MKNGLGPPKVSDFSQTAIRNVVRKEGLTHWLTLYPLAIGLPCGLAGLLFNYPILYILALGTCFISLGSAIVNILFRNDKIAGSYISQLNKKLEQHEQLILESLHKDLQDCSTIKGAEQYASQGMEQFKRIQEKYNNVRDLLKQKLSDGELTFDRFIGAAEQVYLSALDNLKQVSVTLKSAGSIDFYYITEQLKRLAAIKQPTETDRKAVRTLEKRLNLRKEQIQLVNHLLSRNEEAMTKLEETTAAIATMQTDSKLAATEFETAIAQLQDMAQNAHIYNKR